jgi:hypothetical protein
VCARDHRLSSAALAALAALVLSACCGSPRFVDWERTARGRVELRVPSWAQVTDLHESLQQALGRAGADEGDCVLIVRRWDPAAPAPVHLVTVDYDYSLGATAVCGLAAEPHYRRLERGATYLENNGGLHVLGPARARWGGGTPPVEMGQPAFERELRAAHAAEPGRPFVVEGGLRDSAVDVVGFLDEVVQVVDEVYFYAVEPEPSEYQLSESQTEGSDR